MTEELSRVKRRKKATVKKRRPRYFYLIIIILFLATVFVGFKLANAIFAPLTTGAGEPSEEGEGVTDEMNDEENQEPVNILLIGTDQRERESARSDTLILASLFPDEKQVKLLSIPRDTRTKIPGRGLEKIAHAHAYGGADLTRKTVEDLLGISIDYYVKVNFQGFINIIDILGGVTMDVEKRMYYPDEGIDLQPGLQKLDGEDALAYVRFRSDGQGDIGRVERQQKFLSALTDHVKSISTIWKIPDLIKEVNNNVETDMSTKDILYYATKFANIDHESIESHMLPGYPSDNLGASYWIVDNTKLEELMEQMGLK
ncbi:MAG: LCP family protein [Clostridia bacterium]|nr:LCP family protein [Clostridia bacterium]